MINMSNIAGNVIPPVSTFLRRLINLTIGLKKPYHRRKLNLEARADRKAWAVFLEQFNGKGFFPIRYNTLPFFPTPIHRL